MPWVSREWPASSAVVLAGEQVAAFAVEPASGFAAAVAVVRPVLAAIGAVAAPVVAAAFAGFAAGSVAGSAAVPGMDIGYRKY